MTTEAAQMLLWSELEPARAPRARVAACTAAMAAAVAAAVWEQMVLPIVTAPAGDGLADELEPDDAPVVRVWTTAAAAPRPATRAAASVWDLAARVGQQRGKARRPAATPKAAERPDLPTTRVIREGGTVRCVRIQPQDTEEWREREQARRARQRPPKPVRKARTRSKKLVEMIGGDDER